MNTPMSMQNAVHYHWGGVCDGWHLLQGDDLGAIEERLPPGTAELRHRHARARQFFYVLAGVARLEADGVTPTLAVGQGLPIAPGTAYQMRNDSAGELRFMVVSAPKSHAERELAPLGEAA